MSADLENSSDGQPFEPWIAGRVVGVDAAGMNVDKVLELARVFPGFQDVKQQVNGEFFEWTDDPADVSDQQLLDRTRRIVEEANRG